MQSSNRGVRATNEVDAADDEGRPTGGEVYNRPGRKKVLKKCVRPIVGPVINCIAITVGLWCLLDSDYRRPMASIRYIIR